MKIEGWIYFNRSKMEFVAISGSIKKSKILNSFRKKWQINSECQRIIINFPDVTATATITPPPRGDDE